MALLVLASGYRSTPAMPLLLVLFYILSDVFLNCLNLSVPCLFHWDPAKFQSDLCYPLDLGPWPSFQPLLGLVSSSVKQLGQGLKLKCQGPASVSNE